MENLALTEEQINIIVSNMGNYYLPDGDPHNELALALNVSRNEAKSMFYRFLWSGEGLMNRNFRTDFHRSVFLMNVTGATGMSRLLLTEQSYEYANEKEDARRLRHIEEKRSL